MISYMGFRWLGLTAIFGLSAFWTAGEMSTTSFTRNCCSNVVNVLQVDLTSLQAKNELELKVLERTAN